MKAKEIMNKVFIIKKNMTLKKIATIMSQKKISCLVFLKGSSVKGILTERDILKNVCSLNKKISSVMTKEIIVANPNEEIEEIIYKMAQNRIKKILIIEKEKLVGIITATDIIAYTNLLQEDIFS
jgi:CBS domain-containing protein